MNNIRVDFITNTIIVTRRFYEAATVYGTEEYVKLQNVKAANPDMTISIRTVNRSHKPNEGKGLTYRYMRQFISIMDEENLHTFEMVILHYERYYTNKSTVYQEVKKWFLQTYPYHREMIVSHAPSAASPVVCAVTPSVA